MLHKLLQVGVYVMFGLVLVAWWGYRKETREVIALMKKLEEEEARG